LARGKLADAARNKFFPTMPLFTVIRLEWQTAFSMAHKRALQSPSCLCALAFNLPAFQINHAAILAGNSQNISSPLPLF
jgi:hypothetical protein